MEGNKYIGATTAALSGGAKTGFSACTGCAFAGLILTARTGLDIHRMRKGQITEKELKKRMKLRSVKAAGKILGGASGMAAGFALGTFFIPIPVVGGVIGAFVGGFGGSHYGKKITLKGYNNLEEEVTRVRTLGIKHRFK